MKVYAVFYVEFVYVDGFDNTIDYLEKVFDSEEKAKEYVERKGGDYRMKEIEVE